MPFPHESFISVFNMNHALKFIKVDYDENLLKEQQGIYIHGNYEHEN